MHEPATVVRGSDIELSRDEDGGAVEEGKGLPVLELEAEHGAPAVHPHYVQAERLAEFTVNFPEHLVGLDNFDLATVPAQHGFAQTVDGARPHSGLEAGTEINAQAIRLPVIESRCQPFARGHRFHCRL